MPNIPYRYHLSETDIPRQWFSVIPDMKTKPAPLRSPSTGEVMTAEDLYPIFCKELAKQETDFTTSYFDIPEEILEIYKVYRPSPLCRAYNLEKALGTPAHIYYKYEGNNTSGSHKLNSAVAQAYYAKKQGVAGLTTETGAGQWGTALSIACSYFDIPLTVYMVKVSFEQKPDRKSIIQTFGSKIFASPSDTTEIGRKMLADDPNTGGSLGTAISEAVEVAVKTPNTRYVLGSVLNQVLLHQSVIGLEAYTALEHLDVTPDIIIGCAGGGSNLGGLMVPFMRDRLQGKLNTEFIAVEPASCPSLTRGTFAYDFADSGNISPLAKMYTLGSHFKPSANHAGGLRYHGMSPVISQLYDDGYIKAISYNQTQIFEAASLFAKTETILPAPESSHAIAEAINQAKICKETGEAKNIVFGLTGTGYFDLKAYNNFNSGTMTDHIPTDDEIKEQFAKLPKV